MRQNGSLAADVALLLVDAAEGPGQQTAEAVRVAWAQRLPLAVALSRADLATAAQVEARQWGGGPLTRAGVRRGPPIGLDHSGARRQ